MTTPRRHIRDLLKEHLDAGAPLDGAVLVVTDAVLDNEDLAAEIVTACIREEAGRLTKPTRGPARTTATTLREAIAEDVKESPFAHIPIPAPVKVPKPRDIVLDLAGMTRVEALAFAATLDTEAAGTAKAAGFVREVAGQLTTTEKVGDRFDLPTLRAQWGRASVTLETRFFLGDRERSRKAVAG